MAYLDFGNTALAGVIGDPRLRVIDLVQGFSIETTPKQARNVGSFAAVLPRGSRVFIAFIPGDSPSEIVALADRLVAEGMVPVPHVPARTSRAT